MKYLDMAMIVKYSDSYKKMKNFHDIHGDKLSTQIKTEEMELELLATYMGFSDMQVAMAKLFFWLDYATYVPFGKKGEQYLNDYLAHEGKKATTKDIKAKAMLNILEKNGVPLDENDIENRVKRYCNHLYSDTQDFSSVESIVATMRRISGEIDNLDSRNELPYSRTRDDELSIVMEKILTFARHNYQNRQHLDIGKFMPKYEGKLMSPKELTYFKKITGIADAEEKDEDAEEETK